MDLAWSYLYTGTRVERDKLATAMDAATTGMVSTYSVPAIKPGAKLSIDLEDMHDWATSGTTSTVQRGEFGSTAAAHATGSIIHVNAEYTPFEIFREMNNELKSLSSPANGLFRVNDVTLTAAAGTYGYDLTDVTNVEGILNVLAETSGSDDNRMVISDWRLERNVDTATFPSGYAIFTGRGDPGRDLIVVFRDQFGELSSLDDNVYETTGLPKSAHDIIAMGAALRLAWPAEIDRNQQSSQGASRRANEVPAGSRVNAPRGLAQLHRRRIAEESARLKRMWPNRLPRRF